MFWIDSEEFRRSITRIEESSTGLRNSRYELENVRYALAAMSSMQDVCRSLEILEEQIRREAAGADLLSDSGHMICRKYDVTEDNIVNKAEGIRVRQIARRFVTADFGPSARYGRKQTQLLKELTELFY